MKNKNLIEKSFANKRYKAIEKISHETEMRAKSWAIEQAIYFSPFLITFIGWYMYATIRDAFLPYGQSYSYFQPAGAILLTIGSVFTFFSIVYIKPKFEKAFRQETTELSEDVYQKGAKFCNILQYNKNIEDE